MGTERVRVAIIGAGVAGPVLATILRRRGVPCTIFEQTPAFDPLGAGVQLSPNGTRVLNRLGLGRGLRERAVLAQSIETRRWDDGRLLSRVPHGPSCTQVFGAPYLMIHRADLHHCLVSMLPRGTLEMGRDVVALTDGPDEVELRFSDGTTTTADLVIGADGVHSRVREALVRDAPLFSGYAVYRGLIPAGVVPSFVGNPRVLFWLGPSRHITYYPICSGEMVHFSAVCAARDTHLGSTRIAADGLAAEFATWHPEVQRVVAAAGAVTRWDLFDRDIIERYHAGRIVVVGDAAHPTLPFMSQGANQALEDAAVLADCLVPWLNGNEDGPAAGLRCYEVLRKRRTAEVHRLSRARAADFHLVDGPGQRKRDADLAREHDLEHLRWLYGYDVHDAAHDLNLVR